MTGIIPSLEPVNSLVIFTFYGYACGSGRVGSGHKIWTRVQLWSDQRVMG